MLFIAMIAAADRAAVFAWSVRCSEAAASAARMTSALREAIAVACRIDLTRHADPMRVRPIRIAAGAFPDGMPHRDLLVSPDHAVVFDGMLVPAKLLVNGASIAPDMACREVTYFHVELDRRDVILTE